MKLPFQVTFLTGQSDPRSCALTPAQVDFLTALPAPRESQATVNFPYDPATPPARAISLVRASWHNVRQFLAARQPTWAERHRPCVRDLLARAERTLFIAGSCGIELLSALRLDPAEHARIAVLALGPVARRSEWPFDLTVAQGRRDWISRLGWPGPVDHRTPGDHLGYLACPETARLARDWVCSRT